MWRYVERRIRRRIPCEESGDPFPDLKELLQHETARIMAQSNAVRRCGNAATASADTDSHDNRRGRRSDRVDHRLVHLRFEPYGIFRSAVQADHDRDRCRRLARDVRGRAAYAALR